MAAPKKRKDAENELAKKGFEKVQGRGKGSHEVWRDKSGKTVTVPNHGKEIAAGTWRSIQKTAEAAAAAAKAQAEAEQARRVADQGQARPGSGRGSGGQGQRSGQQGGQAAQQPKKKRFFGR